MAGMLFDEIVKIEKMNPYHGRDGRFTTAQAATSFTYKPGASTAHDRAIEREKERNGETRSFKGTLYHGSPATDIEEFDMNRAGQNTSSGEKLLFFTDSKQMAEDFSYERLEGSSKFFQRRGEKGRVYEVDVEMKNALDLRNLSEKDIGNLMKLDVEGILTKEIAVELSGKNNQLLKTYLNLTAASLSELGYDGLIANTGKAGHNSVEYAVVDGKQAKIRKGLSKNFDEILKYNDKHDPKTGQFASKNGGGAAGGNPFPNSKVQAAVYHGTTEDFDDFDTSKSREGNGTIFFSANEDYCEEMISVRGDTGRILTAYINMENPLEVKLKPTEFSDPVVERKYIREAKQNGNDGVIFECDTDDALLADTFYSVFDPKQIAVAETADFAKSADLTPDEEHDMVVKTWTDADGIYAEDVEKGNPYHDPKTGRFTTGPGGSSMIRQGPPPKNTKIAYKLFVAKNGKLYPPMVANPDGQDTPVGVWLDAAEGKLATDKDGNPITNTLGRNKVKAGGKGTQGGSGTLAYRPGWHLGEVPEAKQFYTKDKVTGEKLQKKNFVWAECEIAADFNYQEEAMSYGYNKNGKFQHSLAGLPKIPTDGYYTYRTNPDPSTQPWYITGAMKVNRLLTDAETNAILRSHGIEPMKRDGGELDLAALGFTETNFVGKSAPADINMEKETEPMEKNFEIFKSDPDKRLVFGWASISYTVDGEQLEDRQKDMIDPEDLEEAVYEYVLNFRDTGEEHIPTMRKKGKLVESCVLTEEKQRAMGIPPGTLPIGWWIGFKIEDDDAWERVKNGTYRMFSIEGKANREPVEKSLEEESEETVAKTFNDILGIPSTTRTIENDHPDRFDHIEEVEKSGGFDHLEEVEKFNPYHDSRGRFASANSATSFTFAPGKSEAHDLAIARAAAKDRVAKAKEAEPALTKMMQGCATAAGGELVGLDFCVKGEGSLTRKIKTEMGKNGSNAKAALSEMRDVNRYTMQLGEDNFVSGFESTMKTLQSQGHEVVRVKNTLGDPNAPYRGVNTNIKAPDGSIWELQFHTAKSLEIKEVNHKLYETQRLDKTPAAKRAELGRQMAENAASIPSPAGIEKIAAVNKL